MKRSILLSLLVIGAVAALITAATAASFTDEVTSNGNTFTAGTVNLSADTLCKNEPVVGNPIGGPCNIGIVTFTGAGNLKPGDSVYHEFTVANEGSLGFSYATTIVNKSGDIFACDSPNYATVTITGGGTAHPLGAGTGSIAASGSSQTVRVTVELPPAAGNDCQGDTGQFDVKFVATQS
jgi:predicted ribosomally synthesized peptide with SipW-like signal peptide